jgi:hypothetical protein
MILIWDVFLICLLIALVVFLCKIGAIMDWVVDGDRGPFALFMTVVMAFTLLIPLTITIPMGIYENFETHEEYELWSCDAPFGRYWVDSTERVWFISVFVDSSLEESYTMKYLVGDELKTMILSATAENVHLYLTNDTTEMRLVIDKVWRDPLRGSTTLVEAEYHIYVPDPKLLECG